jgi:hypothetical protein
MTVDDTAKREIHSAKAILDECIRTADFSKLEHLDRIKSAVRALGVATRRAKAEIKFSANDVQGGLEECREIKVRDPDNLYANHILRKYEKQVPQKV